MAFHANNGLYFTRLPDGPIIVEKRVPIAVTPKTDSPWAWDSERDAVVERWILTADDWASIVTSMSAQDENGETFQAFLGWHLEPGKSFGQQSSGTMSVPEGAMEQRATTWR